jgi:hypothetical protein
LDVLRVVFDQSGDFSAINAARDWCGERGVSVGQMQRDEPMGLLVGEYFISKWRNMTKAERAELDGVITGDKRNGPVTLTIRRAALTRIGSDA